MCAFQTALASRTRLNLVGRPRSRRLMLTDNVIHQVVRRGRHVSKTFPIFAANYVSNKCAMAIPPVGGDGDMSDDAHHAPNETAEKDPADWVTGDEPMTGPQRSYLGTLGQEAGREIPADLTKAQASTLIEELQENTGRGAS